MVGLDAAGKTTILYKLKLGEIVTTIPTIGTAEDGICYHICYLILAAFVILKRSLSGWLSRSLTLVCTKLFCPHC